MSSLNKILKFIELTHKFQQVKRHVYATGEDRKENDAEHSYQLALVAWYITESNNLNLDTSKLVKYALVHDLVEVYAGDTPALTASQKELDNKEKREEEALEKLLQEFTEFKSLAELIENYEARKDAESKFIYALDKVLPPANIYLDKGRTWLEHNVTLDMVLNHKKGKLKPAPKVKEFFDELADILDRNKKDLFASPSHNPE